MKCEKCGNGKRLLLYSWKCDFCDGVFVKDKSIPKDEFDHERVTEPMYRPNFKIIEKPEIDELICSCDLCTWSQKTDV